MAFHLCSVIRARFGEEHDTKLRTVCVEALRYSSSLANGSIGTTHPSNAGGVKNSTADGTKLR